MIRNAYQHDGAAIAKIYNHYVATSIATFEETPVSSVQMALRIAAIQERDLPWLVYLNEQQEVVGYAYASPWKERSAYRHSVEVSVYLANDYTAKGIASQLYEALFAALKRIDVRAVIAGISMPNPNSVKLHEKFNMTQVARFDQVGFKFNQWISVGYWQCVL